MGKINYELKKEVSQSSKHQDIVWAFDLGKGSLGEAVRRGHEFLHKATLLITAELAKTWPCLGWVNR